MSDNLQGSDSEEVETPTSELFYGESEQEPTEVAENKAEEELEEESEEAEEEAPEEESESESTEDDDSEAEVYDQPNDFAKYEYDEEAGLYEFKSMGKKVKVNVPQLIKSWQADQKLTTELETIANERKGLWGEARSKELKSLQDQAAIYQEKLGKLDQLVSDSEKTEEYWQELWETDPGEARRQEKLEADRKKAIDDAKQEVVTQREQQRATRISEESAKLLQVVGDDWQDPEVRDKEFQEMQEMAISYGWTVEEMKLFIDHRAWIPFRDLVKFKKAQQKAASAKPASKKTPKKVKTSKAQQSDGPKSTAELFYGSK
jgi:hypothetical protein